MSELSKKYEDIMNEIENNIKNQDDLNFVKDKVADLSMLFIDIIDRMTELTELKMSDLEARQNLIENKLSKISDSVNGIEKDIYAEDNYDFDIVCPYCNNEFVAEYMSETEIKKEIQCPECNNIIELDWNEDGEEFSGCSGSCSTCGGCGSFENEDEEDDM